MIRINRMSKKLEKYIFSFILAITIIYFLCFIGINLFRTKSFLFADATQTSIGARVFWEYK